MYPRRSPPRPVESLHGCHPRRCTIRCPCTWLAPSRQPGAPAALRVDQRERAITRKLHVPVGRSPHRVGALFITVRMPRAWRSSTSCLVLSIFPVPTAMGALYWAASPPTSIHHSLNGNGDNNSTTHRLPGCPVDWTIPCQAATDGGPGCAVARGGCRDRQRRGRRCIRGCETTVCWVRAVSQGLYRIPGLPRQGCRSTRAARGASSAGSR